MNATTIAIEVLLAIAVLVALLCCLGILLMKDFYERLHYMAPVTAVSAFCILLAVVIQEGWGQATIKAILVFLVLLFMNAVLTHATARAARLRTFGHWTPDPNEDIGGRALPQERQSNE
jgi:monovalent cation/proton antiporter MnhG/PhaG subunit